LEGSNRERDWKPKRTEKSLHGTFKFVNYLGSAWIAVHEHGQPDVFPKLRFDVITAKLDYESEYRSMVESIATECQQLLLEWGSPTTVHIASDPEKQAQTLLEQFLFLRHVLGSEKLDLYLETLRRRPHTRLETERDWRPTAVASSTLFIRDPLRFGRDWTPPSAGMVGVVNGMQALEIVEERKFDSLDTPANRFVKFALQNFRSLCDEVMSATISGKSLQEEQGTAWREANSMRHVLDSFLSSSFFDEVGKLRAIPFESQALQKREGYREILHAWLMLDAAAHIDWPGRNDAYDGTNRDVATLYEFWLFFVLVRAFKEGLGMTPVRDPLSKLDNALPFCCEADDGRMTINLKRNQASFCRFTWQKGEGKLRLHFFFNRPFDRSSVNVRGTYSKGFRPDYSLVIIPGEFDDENWAAAERKAEAEGKIAYLHFDAKYRVDNLAEVFGEQESESVDARGEAKATGTVKNADLYKMHTYNEAIRRSVGSYVLYPGDDPKNQRGKNRFERYKEIVPGIGAFALKPKSGDGVEPEGLPFVLQFISDLLNHQLSKFTQSYRISYWTETTLRESPPDYQARLVNFTFDAKPPKDTQVLLGFIHDAGGADACRDTKTFFCRAVEWSKISSRSPDGSGASGEPSNLGFDPFRSDLLVTYHRARSTPWVAKVIEVRLVAAAERAAEIGRNLKEMNASYYYRFQLGDFHATQSRDVSSIVQRRPGKPVACRLNDFAACPAAV
jgi:predicted component of viral defense system (DUF524 family)